jgi:cell division protein ZapA
MTAQASYEESVTTQVTVAINDRNYRLACEKGQEAHLRQLSKNLDDRIAGLRARFGEIGDSRLIIMAALMEADELMEAAHRLHQLQEELASLQEERAATVEREQENQITISAAFHAAAERIESMTIKLNQAAASASSFEKS